MTDKEVVWRPQPGPQTVALSSSAFELLYGGAVGGGKSQALLWGATRQVEKPDYRALILRRTFPELRELMDEAMQEFPRIGGHWIASEKRCEFPSGATIEFGYCESYADVMQYRGQQYQYIGYDEIGDLPDERVWDFLLTRIRSGKDASLVKQARCSANPGGAGHGWLKRRFIDPCPPDGTLIYLPSGVTRAFVKAKLADNPILLENDPEYKMRLDALPDVMREQLQEGNWEVGMGLAFPMLTRTSHRVPPVQINPYWNLFGAFDWGFGHRWAFLLFAVPEPGKLLVVDSTGGHGMVPTDIHERVADLLTSYGLTFQHLQYTVAGSDVKIREESRGNYGPSVLEQFIAGGWYGIMNADQGRVAGYSNLLQYLHDKTLAFCDTPGNRQGIEQMLGLVVDPDAPNTILKTDVNPVTKEGGDDWTDALRYGAMSRPTFRPVATLTTGKATDRHLPRGDRRESTLTYQGLPFAALPGRGRSTAQTTTPIE